MDLARPCTAPFSDKKIEAFLGTIQIFCILVQEKGCNNIERNSSSPLEDTGWFLEKELVDKDCESAQRESAADGEEEAKDWL